MVGVKRGHGNDNDTVLVPKLLLSYVPIKERSTAVQGLVVLSTVRCVSVILRGCIKHILLHNVRSMVSLGYQQLLP